MNITHTRDQAQAKLRDHNKQAQQAIITLIIAELSDDIDQRRVVEEKAARRLRDAGTALGEPEKRLAAANTEIATCEDRITNCRVNAQSEDLDTRVDSEILLDKYLGQLPALQEKAAQIEAELQALYRDRNKAKDQLETEQRYIELHKQAMTQPFTHPLAQQTSAYIAYRLPTVFIGILSRGDRTHPEWDICQRMLGELLAVTGLRDKDWNLADTGWIDTSAYMPSGNEQHHQSGQEIMQQMQRDVEHYSARPAEFPEYLQDRPPANVTHRPEMDIIRTPDEFRKI